MVVILKKLYKSSPYGGIEYQQNALHYKTETGTAHMIRRPFLVKKWKTLPIFRKPRPLYRTTATILVLQNRVKKIFVSVEIRFDYRGLV